MTAQIVKQIPGYKQTEVGAIPEDWEVKPLGEIASVSSGGTPDRSNPNYWNGDVPWVTTTQINFNLIDEANEFITVKGLENSAARIYNPGTLLMAMYGQGKTRGKVAVLAISAAINQACAAIKLNRGISGKYVFFNLSARYEEIRSLSNTGNQENLNATIIKSILLPLPKEENEQFVIANALSDMDALITSLDKLIAKKRDIKQATMQQLLTCKKRLLGFSGEWELKKLEDVADQNVQWSITGGPFGSNLKTVDYVADGVRIIQLQNIGDGVFHDDYRIYTTEEKADELISCNIFPGEIIISKMGDPVARACIVPEGDRRYLMASDGIRLVVNKKRFDTQFVHYYINSIYFRKKAIEASTGSTRQRIGLEDLRKLPFVLPPLYEQHAIANVLSDMDAEIAALEQKRDKTQALKQGMMQELLTGKTRLV